MMRQSVDDKVYLFRPRKNGDLYWTGKMKKDDKPEVSRDIRKAKEFPSKAAAYAEGGLHKYLKLFVGDWRNPDKIIEEKHARMGRPPRYTLP
jgi:hypothetical protein